MLRIDDIHGFAVIEFEGSNPVSTPPKISFLSKPTKEAWYVINAPRALYVIATKSRMASRGSVRFLGIKFRETKQIVVAFVATTLKALFSVAKTNGRLSGYKFYTDNIYYPFLNILAHISPLSAYKKVRLPK